MPNNDDRQPGERLDDEFYYSRDRGLQGGRFAEESWHPPDESAAREEARFDRPARNPIELPRRPPRRASLVELENPDQFLEFHWNPSTYTIRKSASWDEEAVQGGTPTVEYTGCSLTVVSFDLFLNSIGQPHDNQYNVEGSLEWLFSRLRPRTEDEFNFRGPQDRYRQNAPWLNVRDPEAGRAPPTLVLFGLSKPFECVLKDVRVKTAFQTYWGLDDEHARRIAADLDNTSYLELSDHITRATVGITLVEYTNLPSDGTEETE